MRDNTLDNIHWLALALWSNIYCVIRALLLLFCVARAALWKMWRKMDWEVRKYIDGETHPLSGIIRSHKEWDLQPSGWLHDIEIQKKQARVLWWIWRLICELLQIFYMLNLRANISILNASAQRDWCVILVTWYLLWLVAEWKRASIWCGHSECWTSHHGWFVY